MKFRKKPVVIDAEQWLGPESKIDGVYEAAWAPTNAQIDESPDQARELLIMYARKGKKAARLGQKVHCFYVDTLEGFHEVSVGDWIITGVANEKYPCKPDIFEATYEPVDVAGAKEISAKRGLDGPQDDCG